MRISVGIYTGFFSIILLVAIICSIISYSSYSDTVQQNLDESMELAVQMLRTDAAKKADTSEGFVEYLDGVAVGKDTDVDFISEATTKSEELDAQLKENFVKYLTANLNASVTDLEVNIYGADATNGLLSAEVIATFKYPTGNTGTVSCYKTVILDKYLKNNPLSTPASEEK